jgi:hypothetical protein
MKSNTETNIVAWGFSERGTEQSVIRHIQPTSKQLAVALGSDSSSRSASVN